MSDKHIYYHPKPGYLVKDYTEDGDPKLFTIDLDGLWELLDTAREGKKKYTLFELGDCVLDWS